MRLIALMLTVVATPVFAMPQYDTDKACSEMAAIAIRDGMESADAISMTVLCRTLVGTAKDVAEPLWKLTDRTKRERCASATEKEARARGLSDGWYPALVECTRGKGSGKGGRLARP